MRSILYLSQHTSHAPVVRFCICQLSYARLVNSRGAAILHTLEIALALLLDLRHDIFLPAVCTELVATSYAKRLFYGRRVAAYHAHELGWGIEAGTFGRARRLLLRWPVLGLADFAQHVLRRVHEPF